MHDAPQGAVSANGCLRPIGPSVPAIPPTLFAASEEADPSPADRPDGAARYGAALEGSALLVEDNMIIAIDTADMLEEAGLSPVHTAATADEAMARIDRAMPRLALLDVNLGAGTSLAVAERLAGAGVPFALTTGYGEDGDALRGFPDAPVLRKPYTPSELRALLDRIAR